MIHKFLVWYNKFLEPGNLKYTILVGLYTGLFVLAPFISNRIVSPFGFNVVAGSFLISIALGILDVINNDYGVERAKHTLINSLVVRMFIWAVLSIILTLPVVKEPVGYGQIMMLSAKILLAGEFAVFFTQYFLDVHIFNWLKKKCPWFWVRFIGSNTITHMLSIYIFIFIVFYGQEDVSLWKLFIGQTVVRYTMSTSLTPIMAALVYRPKYAK